MSDSINNIANQILSSELSTRWQMRGCWWFEIRGLEKRFEIKLPTVYKDFLKMMGKGAGLFMQGTGFFYKALFGNREAFEEVLELDGHPFVLTKDIFVFSSHQGYIFYFFDTLEDEHDPPVYGYQEGDLKFYKIADKLSTFFLTILEEQKTGWSKVYN